MQNNHSEYLTSLCTEVRQKVTKGELDSCLVLIRSAMATCPDAPQPHNLMGIILEKQGNHTEAMRHFRAAWALDPTYTPAEANLETYATFYTRGRCAFDESDCQQAKNETEFERAV